MERTYNIPLRKEFLKVPKHKRSKRAVSALKKFLSRHMKSDQIKLGKHLNEHIWKKGIKNPPHHVKVTAIKNDEGVVKVELFGSEYSQPTKEELEKQYEEGLKSKQKVEEKPKESKPKKQAKKDKPTKKEKSKPKKQTKKEKREKKKKSKSNSKKEKKKK